MKLKSVIVIACLWSIVGLLFPLLAAAQSPLKVRAAYGAMSAAMAPLWYAQDTKLFEKFGVQVELLYIQGQPIALPALVTKEIDVLLTSGGSAVPFIMNGLPVIMVANLNNIQPYRLVVTPEITNPQGLKGKRMAVSRIGATSHQLAVMSLEKLGLKASDMTFLQVGGQSERLAALKARSVDATLINPPANLTARKLGFNEIFDLKELGENFLFQVLLTRKADAEAKVEWLQRFIRMTMEAVRLMKADRQTTVRIIGKYLRENDREALEESFKVHALSMVDYPLVSRTAVEDAYSDALKALKGSIPRNSNIDAMYDNSLVESIKKENR
ncbi:MAG TPA: ABC transporter substrate-binding protein [Candidatus Binatia bacterium]|nr:ABC transporter substrate-binding protein [Candidatus Binatia bacterium]